MSTQLGRIAKKAKLDRTVRFTSLAHLLTPGNLADDEPAFSERDRWAERRTVRQ